MRIAVLAGVALAFAAAPSGFVPPRPGGGAALAQPAAAQAEPALIASIQELLAALGYRPGAPDGVLGQRTRRAISDFQSRTGMTVDGRPSEALYARLTLALNQGAPEQPAAGGAFLPVAALAAAAPPAIAAAPPTPVGDGEPAAVPHLGLWRVTDAGGASFELALEGGGRVGGSATARFWRWELAGSTIRIVYDNEWGGRVVRTGTLTAERIAGTAEGAGGRTWAWTAERIAGRPDSAAWRAER